VNVAVYVRVSEERQTLHNSPIAQREGGKQFAEKQGWQAVVYEEAKSGASLVSRPEFGRLWADIEKGLIGAVWAKEPSRISRSVEDSAAIRRHFLAYKCRLFIDDVEVDLSDLSSSFMYNVQSAVSEYERGRIAERMARGRKVAFDSGRGVKSRMLGYTYRWEAGKRVWIPDPEKSKIVRMVFEQWVAGVKITAIKQNLNAYGLSVAGRTTWSEKELWWILGRPEYVGLTHNSDRVLIKSQKYEPIIDREVWDRAQTLVRNYKAAQSTVRVRKASDELSGVIRCPICNQTYKYRNQHRKYKSRVDPNKVSDYVRDIYYHKFGLPNQVCTNKTKTVYKNVLAPIMRALYTAAFSDPESVKKWKEQKLAELKARHATKNEVSAAARARLEEVETAKKRLLDSIEQGKIPAEWIGERVEKLRADEARIKTTIAETNKSYEAEAKRIEDGYQLINGALEQFDKASQNERRLIYKSLLRTATLVDGKLHLVWINDMEYTIDIKQPPEWLFEQNKVVRTLIWMKKRAKELRQKQA
jgi:DNA invertase Pin-like site-specific DNA recombinase